MSVCKISKVEDCYAGYSSDDKPTTGVSPGARFMEIDTGASFIFFNETWEKDLTLIYALTQVLNGEV